MYNCDCGHWRCSTPVSRSTWYRHKMARILQNHLDPNELPVTEPLPVEEAAEHKEDVHQQVDVEENKVRILVISYDIYKVL